jgi:Zn-dependent peptidase ImmA (M78 family)/DNA-binding XRE family transcriptional regulator
VDDPRQSRSIAPTSIDPVAVGFRLIEARRSRGLTQQQVADALGIARTTVTAMEKGERRPRSSELVRLAELYGRHVADLTRPLPPERPLSFAVQFRGARGAQAGENPSVATDIAVFQALCEDYVELERLTNSPLPRRYPEIYDIAETDPERAGEEVASSERLRLGLGDGPIGDLWSLLEADVGLRLFAPAFSSANAGMFLFTAEYGGCIAVNGAHPEERRRWTAAHEYGHFLVDRHKPEITVLTSRRVPEGERFADAFARHFLMPAAGLTRQFQAIKRAKDGPITPADVLILCRRYGTSFMAMMLRLEQLRLLEPGSLDRLNARGFKPAVAGAALGIPPAKPELRMLPLRFELLAVQAFEQGDLSEGQFARILRVDRIRARERVIELTQPAPDYANGAWRQAPLDLSAALVGQ